MDFTEPFANWKSSGLQRRGFKLYHFCLLFRIQRDCEVGQTFRGGGVLLIFSTIFFIPRKVKLFFAVQIFPNETAYIHQSYQKLCLLLKPMQVYYQLIWSFFFLPSKSLYSRQWCDKDHKQWFVVSVRSWDLEQRLIIFLVTDEPQGSL